MRLRYCTVFVSVALMVTSGLAGPCAGDDAAVKEEGTFIKEFLGGGDYVMARAPAGDSWIAVVYGTGNQTVKSPITIVAMWDRTLAGSEVRDAAGKIANRSRPMNVRSLLTHRIASLIEFNDTNGDGIGNVAVSNQPVASDQIFATEPVYKAVSLRQAWARSPVTESTAMDNGTLVRSFGFDLTATDLDYIVVGNRTVVNASPGDGRLNLLRFTFQLRVFVSKTTVSVPFYNISLSALAAQPANATRLPDRTYNATTTSVRLKADHLLEGWDCDPDNTNPRLILESGTTLCWAAAPATAAWMDAALVQKTIGGGGTLAFTPDGGKEVTAGAADETLLPDEAPADGREVPRKLAAREIRLSDNWEKCGWFTWTSDVRLHENETAPASAGQAYFQVQGARRAAFLTDRGAFSGVQLLGGLSYPCAWKVVHDPELGVEMSNVDVPYFGPPENHAPTARITSPPAGKQYRPTDNVKLDGSSSSDPDGDGLSYVWMEGTRSLGTSAIVMRKFGEGTHRVSLTIHDGRGGFDTETVNFTVKKERTPGFGTLAAASAFLAAAVLAAVFRRRS